MGLLDRWDRGNQKAVEREKEREVVVEPGVVAISSMRGLLPMLVGLLVVVGLLVMRPSWDSVVLAVILVPVLGALSWNLLGDLKEDVRDWKASRRASR